MCPTDRWGDKVQSSFLVHLQSCSHLIAIQMCQGSTPEYFEFKESPPELPPGWLCSRFLDTPPESDPGTGPKEYIVSKTAPCPIIDAHVHGMYRPFGSIALLRSFPPHPLTYGHVLSRFSVFPQKLMDAVWTFFDNFYWPVRYKETYLANRADFLIQQGVHHVVLLVQVLATFPCSHAE